MFYPSRVYSGTKSVAWQPEYITRRIMVNPRYRVRRLLLRNTNVLVDSSAFQDIDHNIRLTPEQALDRQLTYKEYLMLHSELEPGECFEYEAISIYDQMIGVDEWIDPATNKKVKRRGTEETAKYAVEQTLYSADYYYSQRNNLKSPVIYIAQGATPRQYIEDCAVPLLNMMRSNYDYFGFGGFCIIGRQRKQLLPVFKETVECLVPILAGRNIHRVHLYGVCLPEAITMLADACTAYNIAWSTDSSAPEVAALAFGKRYNGPRQSIHAGIKHIDYDPITLAYYNIKEYTTWTSQFYR